MRRFFAMGVPTGYRHRLRLKASELMHRSDPWMALNTFGNCWNWDKALSMAPRWYKKGLVAGYIKPYGAQFERYINSHHDDVYGG